jgi:hypothetical protein
MRFCCEFFGTLVDNAGSSGFSVVLKQSGDICAFFLQGRVCDCAQEDKLRNLPIATDPPRPFVFVFQTALRFCPFCGMSLDSILSSQQETIQSLVHGHNRFVL